MSLSKEESDAINGALTDQATFQDFVARALEFLATVEWTEIPPASEESAFTVWYGRLLRPSVN